MTLYWSLVIRSAGPPNRGRWAKVVEVSLAEEVAWSGPLREPNRPGCHHRGAQNCRISAQELTGFLNVLAVQKVLTGSGSARRLRLMKEYFGHRLVARPELDNTFWRYLRPIFVRMILKDVHTCWHIEMRVGVSALESGVVPRKRTTQIGRAPGNQSECEHPAAFASKDVFPQPPSPYKTRSLSEGPRTYWWILSSSGSRP